MQLSELSALAIRLANDGFQQRVEALIDACGEDAQMLADAAHSLTSPNTKAGTPEHVAFTYLSAAFHQVTASVAGDKP